MNKIRNLLEEKYVIDLFRKEVLPLYPDFADIKKVKIKAHKDYIWESSYHVVIEFTVGFITKEKKAKTLAIFCSAHSEEPRKNVYDALKYLWDHSFAKGFLTIPHPLFYSEHFNATFYRGVEGHHLYYYIRKKNREEIEKIIPKAAALFAKLHAVSAETACNFNSDHNLIRTVVPNKDRILDDVKKNYPEYFDVCQKAYEIFIKKEENFLASTDKRWLIHGDAHPENIIKMGKKKIALIDFTDICLGDFARDLGCFLQQLEYMSIRKIEDREYTEKLKKIFLDHYLKNAKIKLDDNLQGRINNYYNWTTMRTATFFLLKYGPQPERAIPLIEIIKKNLNIK